MAQRFNRAMEIMGWRVPAEDDEVFEEFDTIEPSAEVREVNFRAHASSESSRDLPAPTAASVRRIVTVHPSSFADARLIGDAFRQSTPVIMNLEQLGEGEARRIVDFAAGLVFGLHGAIERVTPRVFLLSPRDVEVSSQADGHANSLFV